MKVRCLFFIFILEVFQLQIAKVHLIRGDLQQVIIKKETSARFLEREKFPRSGEEADREGTEHFYEEMKPTATPHPCFNTKSNHNVTTPSGEKVLCLVPSEEMLEQQIMKEANGFNRHYVAITAEAANSLFEDPFNPLAKNDSDPGKQWRYTGKRKRSISNNRDRHYTLRAKRNAVGLQNCEKKGDKTEQNFKALCTECWWITKLPNDKFPPYLNERICGMDVDKKSQLTEFCNNFNGQCVQRSMTQDLLRRTDRYKSIQSPDPRYEKAFIQEWELYTQPIRNCCQCQNY